MSTLLDGFFDLLVGFGSVHIMIFGIIAGVLGALVSVGVWIASGQFVRALPGLALVLLVPMLQLEIIPKLEFLAVPAALVLLFITFLSHARSGPDGRTKVDTILSIVLGLALVAFVIVQILSSLTGTPGTQG